MYDAKGNEMEQKSWKFVRKWNQKIPNSLIRLMQKIITLSNYGSKSLQVILHIKISSFHLKG